MNRSDQVISRIAAEDVVIALGERFSSIEEALEGVLRVHLGGAPPTDPDADVVELRLEDEWVRIYAPTDRPCADANELYRLMRENECLHHARYGIQDGGVVLRADVPLRLWRTDDLHACLEEIRQVRARARESS